MRTKEVIKEIEDNGGLDVRNLRRCYKWDKSNESFKSWLACWFHHNFSVSRYVAMRCAEYYATY